MQTDSKQGPKWRPALIQQWLLLLLLGACALLLIEIRFEHQAVMGETWLAWIPLVYLGFMLVAIPLGLLRLQGLGKKLLILTFAGLSIVGLCGFWFHAEAKPFPAIGRILATITSQPGHLLQTDDEDFSAPLLAPLAFVGLGIMGVLVACLNLDHSTDHTHTTDMNRPS